MSYEMRGLTATQGFGGEDRRPCMHAMLHALRLLLGFDNSSFRDTAEATKL